MSLCIELICFEILSALYRDLCVHVFLSGCSVLVVQFLCYLVSVVVVVISVVYFQL